MQRVTDAMLLRAAVGRLCEACCRCCVAAASAVGCPIDTDAGIAGPAKPQSANALLCCLPRGDGDHHGSCSLRSLPLRALQLACLQYYVCMYVFKYVRRLANIGRQPQGAALQYQKELASGNEIGRRTEQRCYPEKPRSQGLSKKWHGWAIRSQERTLPHSGTHVHCQDR